MPETETPVLDAEPAKTRDFDNVEIWSAGKYNGDEYTESDLDAMAAAHAEIGDKLKPYMKLGHDDGQALLQKDGYPSAGWITNVKRVGSKLYADIKGVPKKIAELIDRKAYGRFSPEIYWNLKADGRTYRRALKALALLGADTPANLGLTDFVNMYAEEFETIKSYHAAEAEEKPMEQATQTPDLRKYEEEIASLKAYKAEAEAFKAEAEKRLADSAEKEYKSQVDKLCTELKDYMVPASEHAFRAMCEIGRGVKTYSAKVEDKTVSIDLSNPLEVVKQFVSSLPKVNVEGPVTRYTDERARKEESENSDEALHQRVTKYAAEKGISYTAALKVVGGKS